MKQKRVGQTYGSWIVLGAMFLALVLPTMAEAKRLGSGSSVGRSAVYAKPAKPLNNNADTSQSGAQRTAQSTADAAKTPAAQGAATAQAAKRNWLGPVMGIAAGLGLAALFSSMGLGAGLAQVLSMLLLGAALVAGVVVLMRFLRSGRNQGLNKGLALQGVGGHALKVSSTYDLNSQPAVQPASFFNADQEVESKNYPANFDSLAFLNNAKTFFVTLQGLNDSANWNELRRYCTQELAESFIEQAKNRMPGLAQRTEIMRLDAEILSVHAEGHEQVAAVSYCALLREDETSLPHEVQEVWTLTRALDGSSGWVLAGIHTS